MILDELKRIYSIPENVCCKQILIRYRKDGEEKIQRRCAYEFVLWRDRLVDYRGTQIPVSRVVGIVEENCVCEIIKLSGLKIAICGNDIIYPQRGFLPVVRRGDVIAICDKEGRVLLLKGKLNGYYVKDLWCYVW